METEPAPDLDRVPPGWRAWRTPSPLEGRRPSREELALAVAEEWVREDVLPFPTAAESAGHVRLLIVGINPSPWTAATNAPFSRPGNRFWPSLHLAGVTPSLVDASRGLSAEDERMLAARGVGITNFTPRPTARADELSTAELQRGGTALLTRIATINPTAVAVVGVTAFRSAFSLPRARIGVQSAKHTPVGWPPGVQLFVLPNPSGLNAHETSATLALNWEEVWATLAPSPPALPET